MTFLRMYRGLKSENKCKSFDIFFDFVLLFGMEPWKLELFSKMFFMFLEHGATLGATLDIDFEYNMVSSNYNFDSNFLFLL